MGENGYAQTSSQNVENITITKTKFGSVSCWRPLRNLDSGISGRFIVEQPSPDDFANMLAQMFSAISLPPGKLDHLTEPPWAFRELKHAIHRLKSNKGDDIGLVAEMLRYLPDNFFDTLFTLFNDVLKEGCVLHIPLGFGCWQYHRGQNYQLTSSQLLALVCYTQKFLFT